MKIKYVIGAIPEESRRMQEKFTSAMEETDLAEMLAPFLPECMRSLEGWKKAFGAMLTASKKL